MASLYSLSIPVLDSEQEIVTTTEKRSSPFDYLSIDPVDTQSALGRSSGGNAG